MELERELVKSHKTFFSSLMLRLNKLECMCLKSFFSEVSVSKVRGTTTLSITVIKCHSA
jgi:hypothetical protein